MMLSFLMAAVALAGFAVLCLLRPWQRQHANEAATAREINAGIYRDQLSELERDLAAGTIANAEAETARLELQRRLLDDAALADTPPAALVRSQRTALILAVAIPVLASGLYAWRGSPAALQQSTAAAPHRVTAAEIDQMLSTLAARLQKNPDDPQGWAKLARSYRVLGRLDEANNAFAHIGDSLNSEPVLLVEYADTLAASAGGHLEGKPLELVMTALKLDPENGMALSLAATAAYKRQDFPQATLYWERLLKQLPPESEDAQWLVKTLAEIRDPNAKAPAAASSPAVTATAGASVSGRLSLAPELAAKTQATDTVFVFARAATGPRMPLAVQRARVADLPLNFKLDDSMAVSPQFKLSGAAQVRIEARISRSGDATPAAGDLIGASDPVPLGAANVVLRIDQVRP